MKKCKTCKINKPKNAFCSHKGRSDGLCDHCKDCKNSMRRNDFVRNQNNLALKKRKENPEYKKKIDDESKKRSAEYRKTEKGQIGLKTFFLKKYGLTYVQFQEMLFQQDNKCLICEIDQSEFQKSLCVDHYHNTGKIRGLLCGKCNTALGLFNDDISLMNKAINYLITNREV